ncbi:hypothetical protein ACFZAG_41240 [Streptomyces sp. NPDC012403]|uniref:hypothetical protein n=1 Tax=Streptomyces sp. NPDC012403 TaxID=3364831 RepID=UPI0036F12790
MCGVAGSLTVRDDFPVFLRYMLDHPQPQRRPSFGMWISPAQDRWAVLLTNKLYYTRDHQPLTDVRNAFRELAFA